MPIISILLVITLFITLFLYPNSSSTFPILILIISIGIAIIFTIHRNWEIHQQAQEPEKSNGAARKQFIRNTIIDLLGLALTMGTAIWLGRLAGGYAGQAVGINIGLGWGMIAGHRRRDGGWFCGGADCWSRLGEGFFAFAEYIKSI